MAGSVDLPALFVSNAVRAAVLEHLQTATVELGGLLIGSVGRLNPATPHETFEAIVVSHSVAAEFSEGTSVSLRMPAHVWSAANQIIEAEQTTQTPLRVVGWYHSHPNLGAFFSQTDRQTQAHFFNHAYSLGWVIDPTDGDEAWFIGANCKAIGPIDQA
jgi:proteasome lid subunit RPN8/RPN11